MHQYLHELSQNLFILQIAIIFPWTRRRWVLFKHKLRIENDVPEYLEVISVFNFNLKREFYQLVIKSLEKWFRALEFFYNSPWTDQIVVEKIRIFDSIGKKRFGSAFGFEFAKRVKIWRLSDKRLIDLVWGDDSVGLGGLKWLGLLIVGVHGIQRELFRIESS